MTLHNDISCGRAAVAILQSEKSYWRDSGQLALIGPVCLGVTGSIGGNVAYLFIGSLCRTLAILLS